MRGRSFWWMIASTCRFICGMDWYLYDRLKRSRSLSNICVFLICRLRVLAAGQDITQYNISMFRRNCRSFLSLRRRRWRLRDRLFPGTHGGNSICKMVLPSHMFRQWFLRLLNPRTNWHDFRRCTWIIARAPFPPVLSFFDRHQDSWDNTTVLVDMRLK